MKLFHQIIIIIFIFLVLSDCYNIISKRKKKHSFPNVKLINYLEHPTCKEIVNIINDKKEYDDSITKKEYYGDVEQWMKLFSNRDDMLYISNAFYDYHFEIHDKYKPLDANFVYENYKIKNQEGIEITIHFALFPKKLRKGLKKCFLKLEDGSDYIFDKNECIELTDDELRGMIAEIIDSSGNIKQFFRDKIVNFFKKRDVSYCDEITNYSDGESEKYNFGLGYKSINCLQTSDMKNVLPSYYVDGMNGVINRLRLALESECQSISYPKNGSNLFRGQYFKKDVNVGDVIANLGFLSTSLDINIGKKFAKFSGNEGVLFIIKNTNFSDDHTVKIKGKYIKPVVISLVKHEEEVLLLPNQCFKIISINIIENLKNIELETINCNEVKDAISF